MREPGTWGAIGGQAENGVVQKEEEAWFNGMEIEQVRENEMEKTEMYATREFSWNKSVIR